MSDELSPEMLEEAAPDLLTLEDEDGKEVTFEVIDATEVNGTRYLAVIPYQEDPESLQEEAELILMRIGTDDQGEYMDIVDDDEELLTVGKVFEERLRAIYDIDDSELDRFSWLAALRSSICCGLYRILLIKFWEPASDAGLQTSRPWRKKGA